MRKLSLNLKWYKIKDDNEDGRFLKAIDIFCEQEILFFDPLTNKTMANSRIYEKVFEEWKIENGKNSALKQTKKKKYYEKYL